MQHYFISIWFVCYLSTRYRNPHFFSTYFLTSSHGLVSSICYHTRSIRNNTSNEVKHEIMCNIEYQRTRHLCQRYTLNFRPMRTPFQHRRSDNLHKGQMENPTTKSSISLVIINTFSQTYTYSQSVPHALINWEIIIRKQSHTSEWAGIKRLSFPLLTNDSPSIDI